MKIKLSEVRGMIEGLNGILEKELPVKPAYWFGKILNKISSEAQVFENTRMKLVREHASKDEKGNPIIDKKTKHYDIKDMEAFGKKFTELLDEEFELDVNPIKIESLGDVNIKPTTMAKLGKLLEE